VAVHVPQGASIFKCAASAISSPATVLTIPATDGHSTITGGVERERERESAVERMPALAKPATGRRPPTVRTAPFGD
jgi:hypothetical protein